MHKKVAIIIVIIVGALIITSGVVGAIIAYNRAITPAQPPETSLDRDPMKQEAQTTPDLSVDLGACTAVSHTVITDALKPAITDVRDAENRGFGYEGNGDRSQTCMYPFSAKDNLNNRLTLTVREFSSEKNKTDTIEGLQDYTSASGVGDKAFTGTETDDLLKQTSYSLFVIKDMKLYTLVVLQPLEENKLNPEVAYDALIDIAKAIK